MLAALHLGNCFGTVRIPEKCQRTTEEDHMDCDVPPLETCTNSSATSPPAIMPHSHSAGNLQQNPDYHLFLPNHATVHLSIIFGFLSKNSVNNRYLLN
ncbi:protein of unknown function [Rhodovastum atsumiense]|nr:protein of unknown function [Rhodovastum atsumiense]